ncbi:hypothetical protein Zmor_000073 [Zophobas morio]|uniref:FAD dependent oxidoreductase domain-containing protein n=1 Tax=Zophobas morio TaxID=2755281 RepID=A0AA38IVN9_9CUCU|nr:hypothetical protein Zmor_000073 [Zophobas morio]
MYTIAVIGGGVIGLPAALAIQKEFGSKAKVIIFADKLSPHTTGDVAAGLWTPYILQNTPQEKVLQWAKATQDYILELWKRGEAKDAGISLQVMVNLSDQKEFKIPEWAKITLGYSEIPAEEVKSYNDKYAKRFTGGFTFVSFIWEASKFLPYLQKKFVENGGEVRVKNVQNFEEVAQFDVIVNCTGLNSRFLVPDLLVRPVRGQIARVHAPWQFHCFMTDEEHGHYIIPNQECVILGGTHQEGDFSTAISEQDKKFIFDGCVKYIPALKHAPVLKHQAGLRPGRDQVRLELERRNIGGKEVKIVHNYGHGGSGVTLSIGCAEEAAQLVKEALKFFVPSKL